MVRKSNLLEYENPVRSFIMSDHRLGQGANKLEKFVILVKGESQRSSSTIVVPVDEKYLVDNDPESAEDRLNLLKLCKRRTHCGSVIIEAVLRFPRSPQIFWKRHGGRMLKWRYYLKLTHLSGPKSQRPNLIKGVLMLHTRGN